MALGQLVHHFFSNQGGVHIKGNQPAITPENRIPLQTHIKTAVIGKLQQLGLKLNAASQLSAQSHLQTEAIVGIGGSRQSLGFGQTANRINVHPKGMGERTYRLQRLSRRTIG